MKLDTVLLLYWYYKIENVEINKIDEMSFDKYVRYSVLYDERRENPSMQNKTRCFFCIALETTSQCRSLIKLHTCAASIGILTDLNAQHFRKI